MAKTRQKPEHDPLIQDIVGVAVFALGALLMVGVTMHHSGKFGEFVGPALKNIAGLGAYVVPVLLMYLGTVVLLGSQVAATRSKLIGALILFVIFVTWCQIAQTPSVVRLAADSEVDPKKFIAAVENGGGYVGLGFSYILELAFARIGSHILLMAGTVMALILLTGIKLSDLVGGVVAKTKGPSRPSKVRAVDGKRAAVEALQRAEIKSNEPLTEKLKQPAESKERPEILSIFKRKIGSEEEKTAVAAGAVVARKDSISTSPPMPRNDTEFKLPPITLLKEPPPPPKRVQAELNYKIDVIERTLEEFKIEADVVEVAHGPTVTRYEIVLAPGIKVSKIVSLADNLAMALSAIDVRVEAPIPGKSAIGVEVPNSNPAIVTMREVIDNDQFKNAPSKLTFALGKDVAGEPRYADLTKMPHMLVAGATNSGKSIGLNTLIASLLFRVTPREVKFILIDPKRVELSLFDGIPHLCTPVVKDVRQATGIFRAALKEMDHRYDLFVMAGTRNFDGYNAKVKPEERLPYIVIIVDELADLMMQAGPDIEFAICRLAQLARATGIHLVIATQRPSVDVITGTIKANISSRIAFAANSAIDSRTILDMSGAERLIGRGDMLFKPIDASKPTRIQGCYVSEKEIEELVKYLKEQETPDYTMTPMQIGEGGSGNGGAGDDAMADEMYEPAVRLIVTHGSASTSMLQRKFKIGYTRAARLVDAMEEMGIVGPLDGAKPRDVLISKDDIDRIFGGGPSLGATQTNVFEDEE